MEKRLDLIIEGLVRNYNKEESELISHAFKAGFYELSDKEKSDEHRQFLNLESNIIHKFLNLGRRYANSLNV